MKIKRVSNLSKQEVVLVCNIHNQELTKSILNKFGLIFLKLIYSSFPNNKNNIFIVAKFKSKIVGYLVATTNIKHLYGTTFFNNPFLITYEIAKSCLYNPKLIFQIFSFVLTKPNKRKTNAELQFIAIKKEYQNKGIGKMLLHALDKEFTKDNISQYYVGTKAYNRNSNYFYQRNKFKKVYTKNIMGDKFNYYLSPKTS